MSDKQLGLSKTVTLATVSGVVTGRISIGPDDQRGPATWVIDTIIMKTTRPGTAPIPRVAVDLDGTDQFLSYDGSFKQASGTCTVVRGQKLNAVWTGGTAGDVATLTVTGVMR